MTCSHEDVYQAKEFQVENEEMDPDFKKEVLESLRQDEIGKLLPAIFRHTCNLTELQVNLFLSFSMLLAMCLLRPSLM